MKKLLFFFTFIFSFQHSFAQFFGQVPVPHKYNASKVIDPDYGITIYEKLNFYIGGDSVRNDLKGYACQGWLEDIYETGSSIHKGFYEDGHLRIYKNFFPNGNVERSFKLTEYKMCNMQIFYQDGKLKADITYFDTNPQLETDYYENGQVEYVEENSKKNEYLVQRKSFAEDGKPQEIFELTDPKKKIYSKKEYYENGKIKSEGSMKYNPGAVDYQKEGTWNDYDEQGKMTTSQWVKGEEVSGQ